MESLSSAETPATAKRLSGKSCSCYSEEPSHHQLEEDQVQQQQHLQQQQQQQVQHARQNEQLQQEVNKLKCDKLELLRQNVVSRYIFLWEIELECRLPPI